MTTGGECYYTFVNSYWTFALGFILGGLLVLSKQLVKLSGNECALKGDTSKRGNETRDSQSGI